MRLSSLINLAVLTATGVLSLVTVAPSWRIQHGYLIATLVALLLVNAVVLVVLTHRVRAPGGRSATARSRAGGDLDGP